MKNVILIITLLFISNNAKSEWLYEKSSNSGAIVHSAFVFDEKVENALSVSCDKEINNLIITFLTDVKLSKKDVQVISLTFDNDSKVRYDADYGDGFITLSDYRLNEQGSSQSIKSILNGFKTKSKVTFGFVNSNNKSDFVNFSLNESFENISKVEKFCE